VGGTDFANELVSLNEFSELSGQRVSEIVRLETIGEELFTADPDPLSFYDRFESAVNQARLTAVGFKSIIAYRYGFKFEIAKPSRHEVELAVASWRSSRMSDPVLLRFALWTGVETGLPVQLHAGFGDNDLTLHDANPVLLTDWLRTLPSASSDIVLLHCYPYHREAGYLAQVFNKVYFDVGLAVNFTGARSRSVVAESLELAPFSKILFSTDAWGLPELHFLGSTLWRGAMTRLLTDFVRDGEWSQSDAIRVAHMIGHENATRLYSL
jgi:predicted TIM-barrel fold metal-dependent hydrolase